MKGLFTLLFAVATVAAPAKHHAVPATSSSANSEPPRLAQYAPTKYVNISDGTQIAYRRFGKASEFPLLYLNHLRQSMDVIDPLLMNHIAENRDVIVFDNLGVGHSQGEVPASLEVMGVVAVELLAALSVPKVDILGFSMGGAIAQYIGMEYPHVVHKLVLAGTQSAVGPGVQFPDPSIFALAAGNGSQPTEEAMLTLFFSATETSLALGHAWWRRLSQRNVKGEDRIAFVEGAGINAQLTAISAFASNATYFDRLQEVSATTLVTNGANDVMAPTVDSYILQQQLPRAELHIYPDSGHGHLFQFPELYARNLETFLEN
ncbi:Alpha/Beta hydrolase protein [Boeremia exigua]|uniref:Alpha/Beta hydrolase protein n=1 Tax=Boeremia exigua TaxID=749465 RepID=UPI001E8CB895|nr:Alpha/Beta hydrolase protein [Boeremia exigua]KAH6616871.1 Alpha/Beta hydrolase protein [Boeremia exigua]